VFAHIPTHLPHILRSPRNIAAVSAGAVAAIGIVSYLLLRRKPTPEEIEYARRDHLAHTGRITDGSITETQWLSQPDADAIPGTLTYSYQIGGVIYECAQDVTALPHLVRHIRVDLPIQVRFDPRNPADSIVVAETWSGLRIEIPPTVSN
jgi:hypothetical protein